MERGLRSRSGGDAIPCYSIAFGLATRVRGNIGKLLGQAKPLHLTASEPALRRGGPRERVQISVFALATIYKILCG